MYVNNSIRHVHIIIPILTEILKWVSVGVLFLILKYSDKVKYSYDFPAVAICWYFELHVLVLKLNYSKSSHKESTFLHIKHILQVRTIKLSIIRFNIV